MANTPAVGRAQGASRDRSGQWSQVARKWNLLGPPLRPSPEDARLCETVVGQWCQHRGAPRVLLLGVTPELYRLPWPEGTELLAVDRTVEMIEAVWPGPRETVRCEDWLDMRLPDASRDIVLCDGGFNFLAYPEEQQRLVGILGGALSDGGLCIVRLFVPPAHRESRDEVLEHLLRGDIPTLDMLKLRLWMALQASPSEGVELDAVWRTITSTAVSIEELAARIGWPLENALAINAYRGSRTRYWFGTVDEVTRMFCQDPGGFERAGVHVPSYEGGRQCPTVVFRRTRRATSTGAGPEERALRELLDGYQDTALIHVAAKLGLADLLAGGAKTSEELAGMTGAHGPSLHRILRGLAVLGIVREDEGRFGITPRGKALQTNAEGFIRNLAIVCGEQYMGAWSGLCHSAMTGETAFKHVFGVSQWEHRQRNLALSEHFNAALNAETARAAGAIVEAYDFSAFDVICDVGGGYGALLCAILGAYPHASGILFEQGHVAAGARAYVGLQRMDERCRIVEGHFFEGVPPGAGAYILKSIIHDWSDEHGVALLRHCRTALGASGRVMLVERVVPAMAKDAPDTIRMDLHMLAVTGGRERNEAEYRTLLEAAGFGLGRIVPTRSPFSIVEGVPR